MRATPNLLLQIWTVLLLLAAIAPLGKAQGGIGNTTSTPVAGVPHDYITGLNEIVNPANGALSIRIPQPVPPERGHNWPAYAFMYDSNGIYQLQPFWQTSGNPPVTYLKNLTYKGGSNDGAGAPGSVSSLLNTLTVCQQNSGSTCITWTCLVHSGYVFGDPNGGQHGLGLQLAVPQTNNSPNDCTFFGANSYFFGGDEQYKASMDHSGNVTVVDSHGNVPMIEDANGNYGDTTHRTAHLPAFPTYQTETFNVSYSFNALNNSQDGGACGEGSSILSGSLGTPGPTSVTATKSVTLANGQEYSFQHDSVLGLLNKITYPTGATVTYTWSVIPNAEGVQYHTNVNNSGGTCSLQHDWFAITKRVVSFDGVTNAEEQDFAYNTVWPNAQSYKWTSKSTTVTTKDLIRGTSFNTIYNYLPAGPPAESDQPTEDLGYVPVENTIQYYDTNGSLLKTITKSWATISVLAAECETLPNGQISGKFYSYAPYAPFNTVTPQPFNFNTSTTDLPTDVAEYDNGQVATACVQPGSSVLPIRETVTAYQTFPAGPLFPYSALLDRPSSVKVYGVVGGTKTLLQETDYAYDAGTPAGVSPTPYGHDETNYGSGSTAPRGNLTTVTKKCFVGTVNCTNSVTNYTYDTTGQALTVQDADLNTTTYTYADNYTSDDGTPSNNTNAYVTKITRPITNGVSHITKFQYGFNDGKLRAVTDENNQTTAYCYWIGGCTGTSFDPFVRLTGAATPDGGKTTITYNDAPFNSSTPSPSVTITKALTSTANVTSLSAFDGLGNAVRSVLTSDPDCASGDRTDTTYDGLGRVFTVSNPYCSTSDPTYGLTTNVYDALGRSTSVTEPDGSVITMAHSGNTTTVTDEAGKKRQSTTDGLRRLSQAIEDLGGLGYITNYGYDALGNLTSVVQNGSRQRTFSYDSLSRLTQAVNPESGTTTYSYDANGNLTGKTDARNISVGYSYDALNRLTSKTYSPNFAIDYYYDQTAPWGVTLTNPIGRLTSMGTYDGTCWPTASTFGYDAMGRVTFQEDYLNTAETSGCPGHFTAVYASYDLAGNQTSLTYPSGRVIKSQYNGGSRLTNLKVDDLNGYNYLSSATYAPNGSPATFALGNALTETSTYNKRFQPNDLKVAGTSSTLIDHSYNFNNGHNNGNVTSIADNVVSGRTQNFTYDSLNRLYTAQTSATSGSDCWGAQFGYDAWGNLLTNTPTNCTFYSGNFSVNANNQITNAGFSYDAAGNMTNDGLGGNNYVYDNENHLTSFNSGAATYIYDAQGRRMAKKIGSATTEYIYFNGDVLSEYNLGDQVWNDYVFASGRRLAAAGTDDIFNPGFEQGLEGWNAGADNSTGTAQVITDPTRAHSGNNYLQLSTTTASVAALNQLVAVNPGDHINFGGWVYIEPGSATGGYVVWDLGVLDANGNPVGNTGAAATTSGTWTYLSTSYTVPAGGASAQLYCQIYQPTGATTARFDDGFLTGASGLGVRYYHADHLGSARLMTDSAGNVTWSATYLPFGQEWNPQPTTNHYKFTGKARDSESGLDDFDVRYYSSSLGRFMRPDPAQWAGFEHKDDPQAWNGYAYGRNNPLLYTDPDGANYTVCDVTGRNCADLTDDQYKQFRQDNPNLRVTPTGDIYTINENGTETKTGSASYYNEKNVAAAQTLATIGSTLGDVRTIGGFYGISALGGFALYSAGLYGGSLTTLELGGEQILTNQAAGQIIGWGTGQAGTQATEQLTQNLTKEAVQEMIKKGLNKATVEGLKNQYARAAAEGGAKMLNQQLLPRLALMEKIIQLWPK